ncbi:hypothetical protein CFO_g1043 [Ceratocystis platani]|uniref:Retrotransposon gag protein n=1 Tax=Ceratocystis fimbriata f. sp. platani TaxID=88771 RepID=A0A0F8DL54_CERFI|nr:hypothetical protein CFO_g1043 [Ceratocystis platani]
MAPLTTKQPNAPTSLPAVEIRMYNWIFTDPNEEMDGQFYDTVMTTDSTSMDNSSQTTNATMRPSNPVRLYDHSKPLDYPAFRTILKAQWKYHRSRFPTQEDFIIHCFSHLTGPAAMDIEPWIQDMMASKETADVEAFFTHLDNTFMDPAAAARALEKVTALQAKMSTPAQAHITQVTQLLRAAGGNDWADSIKMRYLTATLPRKVRDALATHQETTYTKYAKVVIVVDIPPLSESTSGLKEEEFVNAMELEKSENDKMVDIADAFGIIRAGLQERDLGVVENSDNVSKCWTSLKERYNGSTHRRHFGILSNIKQDMEWQEDDTALKKWYNLRDKMEDIPGLESLTSDTTMGNFVTRIIIDLWISRLPPHIAKIFEKNVRQGAGTWNEVMMNIDDDIAMMPKSWKAGANKESARTRHGNKNQARPTCQFCSKVGHTQEVCRNKASWDNRKITANMSFMDNQSKNTPSH